MLYCQIALEIPLDAVSFFLAKNTVLNLNGNSLFIIKYHGFFHL